MITLPKTRTIATIIEGDYHIFAYYPGDYLLIGMGYTTKEGASFTHPNIIRSIKETYNFKHYGDGGSKWWTSEDGVTHYLAVPRDLIYLVPEKGYSDPKVIINGSEVTLSVSGGSSPPGYEGWTDYVGPRANTAINHPLDTLRAVADVAVRGTEIETKEYWANYKGDFEELFNCIL